MQVVTDLFLNLSWFMSLCVLQESVFQLHAAQETHTHTGLVDACFLHDELWEENMAYFHTLWQTPEKSTGGKQNILLV